MSTITKICKRCEKTFEADIREHNRGNAHYCSLKCANVGRVFDQKHDKLCRHCGKGFQTASPNASYCSTSCKQKSYRLKSKVEGTNMKYLYKDLQHTPCQICGWKESIRDIHHIIPVSKGGKNLLSNLIVICPNHHRMIHKGLITLEDILRFKEKYEKVDMPGLEPGS